MVLKGSFLFLSYYLRIEYSLQNYHPPNSYPKQENKQVIVTTTLLCVYKKSNSYWRTGDKMWSTLHCSSSRNQSKNDVVHFR